MFDKLILPILKYGSEVWGLNDGTKLEGIHIHFCKHILGVRGQTQNNFVYGELGRTSLKSRRVVNVIRYWLKIVQLDNTKFAREMYSLMYRHLDNNPTHMSWARNVKTLLQSTGLYETWVNQGVGNVNVFISLVKQRAFDMFVQNWNTDINNSTRARCYTLYADFRLQSYLILINIEKFVLHCHALESRLTDEKLKMEDGINQ